MVLIIDDDNAVRLSIGLALRKARIESMAVGNEEDALANVRDEKIKAVVLDMNLSMTTTGRQGLELLQKIKILRPEIPVILITAWGTIPLAVKSMNLGAADFVTKPWSNEDLVKKINKALAEAEARQTEESRHETLDEMERQAIEEAIRRCDGNIALAARQLGITRQSLYRRLEKFGLQ